MPPLSQAHPRHEAAVRPCCEALHRRQALSAALGALPFGINHPRADGIVDFSASFAVRASPLANPENVGSTQQLRSYVSIHWAAILIWTNFSAHALASW